MGQAKLRGNKDERAAKAAGLRQRTLDELKQAYGLPDHAQFLGYAVHLEAGDEFLAIFKKSVDEVVKAWAKTPEMALSFQSIAQALDASKACPDSIVVGMFDTGDQIFVAGVTGGDPKQGVRVDGSK